MKQIIERLDGSFHWRDGDTTSGPFAKDSDQYKSLIKKGFKLVNLSREDLELIPVKEDQLKILELENSISKRLYREAFLGNQKSIDKIQGIDDQIRALIP